MYICIVALILPLLTAYGFKIPIGRVPSKSKPHNFKILGKDIAIWWNKEEWSAIDDMCLHRQASLSKGVISKTGDLKCGYHGWEYNKCGKCTHMPSTNSLLSLSVENFQIDEKDGILWLTDPDKFDTNQLQERILENYMLTDWFQETIPLPFDLWIENTMDSLHFNHVHHNTPPPVNRYDSIPVVTSNLSHVYWYNESGFSIQANHRANYTFLAPYTIFFTVDEIPIIVHIVPIDNESTLFTSNLLLPKSDSKTKNFFTRLSYQLSKIFIKLVGGKIFEQDNEQILGQMKHIKKRGKKYRTGYLADKPILLFNQWLEEFNITTDYEVNFSIIKEK